MYKVKRNGFRDAIKHQITKGVMCQCRFYLTVTRELLKTLSNYK